MSDSSLFGILLFILILTLVLYISIMLESDKLLHTLIFSSISCAWIFIGIKLTVSVMNLSYFGELYNNLAIFIIMVLPALVFIIFSDKGELYGIFENR